MTEVVLKLLKESRIAWNLPKSITVSQWADANRVLPGSSAEPGRWRTSRTPYLKGPMDAFNDSHIREMTLMMSTQVGKTETMLNMLGYVAQEDPGPTAWLGAKEQDVKDFCVERIQPIFNLSSELLTKLSKNKDEINKKGIALDNMRMHVVWAGSPSGLASRAIKYVFADEVDKYPPYSGRESDPLELITERTRTFWNHKKIKGSTPTTKRGYIYKEYEKSDKRKYYMPCPHCGEYQIFVWGCVKFPNDERNPDVIKMNRLAYYECPYCGEKITDSMKFSMLEKGIWVQEGGEIDKKGKVSGVGKKSTHAGFWINAIYSPWLTFSDIAAKFLSVKNEPSKLMNFVNSWLAEVWEEKAKKTDVEFLKRRIIDYPEGLVPDAVKVLSCGVDVQKGYMLLTVRGWGVGSASWLIRKAKVESWSELAVNLFDTKYKKSDGQLMSIRLSLIDTGYRTNEVYEFCRRYPQRTRPIKGKDNLGGIPFHPKRLDKFSDSRSMPGGLVLWTIDVNYFKDKLHRFIHSTMDDASQWYIYKNITNDYLIQMCAEDKVIIRNKKTGTSTEVWQPKTGSIANHYWDCEVYNVAAAEMLRVSLLKDSNNQQRVYGGNNKEGNAEEKSWIGDHKDWLK